MTNEQMNEHPSRPALDADEAAALRAIGWAGGPGESNCPDSSLLLAAEDGVLDEDVSSRVRAHAAGCPTCRLLIQDLAVVLSEAPSRAEADRIDARIDRARARSGGRAYWWFGAAGVALAAGLAWVIVAPRPDTPPLPEAQVTRATPAPVPTVFGVDRPAIPPGEIDLAVRGEAATPADLANQVALALDRADAGDVKDALAELDAIVRKNPESRQAGLALGSLQLREERNAEAVATLERARLLETDPDLAAEVDWFLAIARIRIGDRAGARPLLEALCRGTGARSARACAGLAELGRAPSPR